MYVYAGTIARYKRQQTEETVPVPLLFSLHVVVWHICLPRKRSVEAIIAPILQVEV